jgi:hypothetical protein
MLRVPTKEAQQRRATDALFREASERAKNSPHGMREAARGLHQRASDMPDSGDRDTMLRLAADYERRADRRERDA